MAIGDIIHTPGKVEPMSAMAGTSKINHLVIYSFTAGQAAAGERLIHTIAPNRSRNISLIYQNEDAAVNVTVNTYVSNNPTRQATVANVIINANLLDSTVIAAAGGITDILLALSIAAPNGVNYNDLIAQHEYVYITATVAGITTADTMSLFCMEKGH